MRWGWRSPDAMPMLRRRRQRHFRASGASAIAAKKTERAGDAFQGWGKGEETGTWGRGCGGIGRKRRRMARVFRLPGGRRNRLWWTEDRVVRAGARETRRVAPIKKFPTFPETTSSRSRSVRLSARAPSGKPDVARAGGMIPHWRIERNWHFRRVRESSACS